MKHLLKLSALTPKEILHILDVADEYKRLHKQSQYFSCDYNKVLTLILFHGKLLNNIKTVTSVMPRKAAWRSLRAAFL